MDNAMGRVVWLSAILVASILMAACDSGDDDGAPSDRLEVQTGATGTGGTVTFDIAGYDVAVGTETADGDPIAAVGVRAAVTERYLMVVTDDPQGRYYPGVRIVRLPSRSSERINVSMDLDPVGLLLTQLPSSPQFIEELFDEEGFERECVEGSLAAIMAAIWNAVPTDGLGLIFHLTQAVASGLGYDGARTATASEDLLEEDLAAVAALMGTVFGLFDQDFQTVCWGTDATGTAVTPFYWTDVDLDREFALRITLTWGENPEDLDSHLFTPEIMGSRHQVYWLDPGSLSAPPYAALDVDDVTSFGPENIVVDQLMPGTYRYAVHHFAGSGTISTSGALVRLFTEAGLQHSVSVPSGATGDDWWWHVFDIDGATGAVQVVNSLSPEPPEAGAAKMGDVRKKSP